MSVGQTAIATSSVKRPTEDSLRWNMPTHQCTVCDQTFGEKSNLARHLKIHAIARETFSCVVCGKSLATKPSLVSHQRLHQYPNIILYRQGEARLYCTEAARSVAEARSSTVVDPNGWISRLAESALLTRVSGRGGSCGKVLPAWRSRKRAAEVAEGATAPICHKVVPPHLRKCVADTPCPEAPALPTIHSLPSARAASGHDRHQSITRLGTVDVEMLNLHPDVDAAMPECG
ncbi:unnamed protein product [Boreogadus saida]